MKKTLTVVVIPMDIEKIHPIDCIGMLFKTKDGVYNVPMTLEDVQKSHGYFGNTPQQILFVSNERLVLGDKIVGKCNNIETMPLEILTVSDIMPYTKSIFCEGIWTEGSERKIIASYPPIKSPNPLKSGIPIIDSEFVKAWPYNQISEVDVDMEEVFFEEDYEPLYHDKIKLTPDNKVICRFFDNNQTL